MTNDNRLLRDLHDQTAEDANATMIVVARDDLEEVIALLEQFTGAWSVLATFTSLCINRTGGRDDAASKDVYVNASFTHRLAHEQFSDAYENNGVIAHARAEALLARMGVSDE
jgi:hypothetical protein